MIASTSGVDVWYGAGALWNSMIIPIESAMRPATVSAPCVRTCASITNNATPNRISTIPTHEIGSTENPNSATSSATAPSAPGSTTPGWKISKPIPAMPARKSRLMMFGSISALRNRVKKPGFTVSICAPARFSV